MSWPTDPATAALPDLTTTRPPSGSAVHQRPASGTFVGWLPHAAGLGRQRWLLALAVILSVTVLQRFAVPLAGSLFGFGFLICLVAAMLGLMQRVLRIDPARLALYSVAICGLLATLPLKQAGFSPVSLAMLMVLYAPFCAVLVMDRTEYLVLLDLFQRVISFVAWCGLIQFGVQFLLSPPAMFPFDRVLPDAFLIPGYNLMIPFSGGYLKSTGLWFLEPSIFAQALAFGLLIELAYFRRLTRFALYGSAYLTSLSGTGALLLFALAPFIVLRGRALRWAAPALLVLAAMLLLRDLPILSVFFERAGEFTEVRSSGSMRLVAPYWAVDDMLFGNLRMLLFGVGPGQWGMGMTALDYPVLDSGWLKLLFEYGLVGTVPFLVFYIYCLFRDSPDRLLSLACLLQFAFLGGYLNAFFVGFLHMILVVWPRLAPERPPSVWPVASSGIAAVALPARSDR